MAYAQDTSVSVEKSRAELESILSRYGASRFGYMTDEKKAMVAFQAHGKLIRFSLPLPDRSSKEFTTQEFRYMGQLRRTAPRAPETVQKLWEQACRARWRALCLCVKAKLEAVECGITSFEQEFLAHIVLPNGQTMGEHAIPMIEAATKSGQMPTLSLTP